LDKCRRLGKSAGAGEFGRTLHAGEHVLVHSCPS
jgi:hypothetical protein